MQRMLRKRIGLLLVTAATAALMLGGCSDGKNGVDGKNAPVNTTGTVNAGTFTNDNLNNVIPKGSILSASIPNGKNPVVELQVYDSVSGAGITGLKTFGLHIAKLIPEDTTTRTSSYWVNYIDKGIAVPAGSGSTATAATKPSADPGNSFNADGSVKVKGYTVTDKGDGTYTITFASDITSNTNPDGIHNYQPSLIHRIGVTVSSIATPGVTATGPLTPAGVVNTNFLAQNRLAMVYDFTPSTNTQLTDAAGKPAFARDIVSTKACEGCHYKLTTIIGHTGSRPDVKICVMCHTSTNTGGEGEMVTFIHRIHMGEKLNDGGTFAPIAKSLVTYGEQTYPLDIRSCDMCHQGVNGTNWQSQPNRKNCGSCHNAINFATGANHSGPGTYTDDAGCINCHGTSAVTASHLAVIPPDPNATEMGGTNTRTNAGWLPAAGAVVPGAATITWDISSVSRDATTQNPSIKFKFKKNGTDVVFNTFGAGVTEMMNGFAGSPSAYFAFAVPQDGIPAPADFNATANVYIKSVWNGTVATSTLTGPDATGYYTLTMNNVIVPAEAKMLTGGIGYSYGNSTRPLTQIDLPAYPFPYDAAHPNAGGLMTVVPNAWKAASTTSTRRPIVSNALCNECHAKLGIAPTYHAGNRNDAPTCSFCHNVNRVNSGWAVNAKDVIHAIHAAGKRTNKFSWEVSAGAKYWGVTYPGYLRNCEQCHLPGTYDFSVTASSNAVPNLLWSTAATGVTPNPFSSIILGTETVPGTYYAPFLTAGADYGTGFSFASGTGVSTPATGASLVISPISAACYSCHDTSAAKAHMQLNGGSIYESRTSTGLGTPNVKTETCLVCHGTAANALNATVPTIKAVHRWW